MAKYDDLIDEASGELDRVEGQLHRAVQQLLDAQGDLSRAANDALSAARDKKKVLHLQHQCIVTAFECNMSTSVLRGRSRS